MMTDHALASGPVSRLWRQRGFAVRQFFEQPRLRLAWLLAIGGAGWCQTFFIYTHSRGDRLYRGFPHRHGRRCDLGSPVAGS